MYTYVLRPIYSLLRVSRMHARRGAYTPGPYSSLEGMPAAFDCEYLKAMA